MEYRADINGLRAIAVVAVVIFHFNPSWMPGGFAGVDVFFVISGFLMTGIIFRGIEKDNFSILKFYVARANRIIPALAFLCLCLIILGGIYLEPIDYRVLGKHVGSSLSFLSNIIYWSEDGYFDASSHEKWLLHTWSLSVEWQFYIIYPFILVALRNFYSVGAMKLIVLIGSILGLIFCIVATYLWPSSSYYFLTTRAWELMVGGVCYLYPINFNQYNKKYKKLIEWIGVFLIVTSYLFTSKDVAWPGYLSIIPVLGASLIIQAQQNNSLITSNFIFQRLGQWSYSIYLWHWPIVVAIYFYSLEEIYMYAGIMLSIFLGFLSHKFIEQIYFRNNFFSLASYLTCKPLYMVISLGIVGSVVFLTKGLNFIHPTEGQGLNRNAYSAMTDWHYPEPNLMIGNSSIRFIKGTSEKNVLFIGASHIEQTYPYAEHVDTEYNIYYLTNGGCFLTPSYKPNFDCSNVKGYKELLDRISFDKIVTSLYVIGAYLPENEKQKDIELSVRISEFNDFLSFINQKTRQIYLILGEPKGDEFNPILSVRHGLKNYVATESVRKAYAVHYKALLDITPVDNLFVIDPIDHLCSDVCAVKNKKGKYYYKDSDHMRPWYARKVLVYLNDIFQK